MNWIRKGRIFSPSAEFSWNKSHASQPTVYRLNQSVWRIFFATRDINNRSYTTYIDVEAGHPENVLYVHDRPILSLGELGTFDESGIMPSWTVNFEGRIYLYYIGWSLRTTVPYHNAIGLAISDDGGQTFERFSTGPLFGLTHLEPHFTGTSCVLEENGIWRNWYMSTTKWQIVDGKPEPFYHIKYAESRDGVMWKRNGTVAIDYEADEEGGIVRASVLRQGRVYRMWYSHRKALHYRTNRANSYRIGYAESRDATNWVRMDEQVGFDVVDRGWDSEMVAYPYVLEDNGTLYMFYNGNGFGRTGFGYAVMDNSSPQRAKVRPSRPGLDAERK